MAQKFPFCIWNYTPIENAKLEDLEDWAECGLTATMAPAITYGKNDPRELIPYLDKADSLGMQLIVNVKNVAYDLCAREGAEVYEARLHEMYEPLKGHPALFGFVVGDEPITPENIEASVQCIKIQRQIDANLRPYLNLSGAMRNFGPEYFGGRTFGEWMKYVVEETGFALLCFDEYSQVINDGGISIYMQTVKDHMDAADEAGADMWACLLTSAHIVFPKPTEFQIMWQITMSAALGCRGVVWFRFYDRDIAPGFYGSPIDEFGNKTDTFYALLRSQKRFNTHFGEILMKLKHQKSYRVRNMYGDDRERPVYTVFKEGDHDLILDATCFDEGIMSFFKDENGTDYLCLVNASQSTFGRIAPKFDPSKCTLTELQFNGAREIPYGVDTTGVGISEDGFDLYAGQMRLFRIDKK